MRAFSGKNPLFLIIHTGWQFAGRYRPAMIIYTIMFACAQIMSLLAG